MSLGWERMATEKGVAGPVVVFCWPVGGLRGVLPDEDALECFSSLLAPMYHDCGKRMGG